MPDDLIFTIEIAKVTNAPTSASAPNSDELVQGAPEPLVADLVNKTEEDLVKPVAAKSVDCQNQRSVSALSKDFYVSLLFSFPLVPMSMFSFPQEDSTPC